ncbi:hypothetical protein [Mycobacterium sp. M26]|uniref:hypothetical protein n=1 Tax=Mycobacterium sp. M26 TaxID=1762962 RepID=UPI00073F4FB4|nr:hypothetical protein [Mycobacterium sp. M26]
MASDSDVVVGVEVSVSLSDFEAVVSAFLVLDDRLEDPVDFPEEEDAVEEPASDGAAAAIPGPAVVTATPMPSATASAPTRPTYLPHPVVAGVRSARCHVVANPRSRSEQWMAMTSSEFSMRIL